MDVLLRPWRYWGGGAPWGVVWLGLLAGAIALSVLAAQHDRLPGDLDLTQRLQDSTFPGLRMSKFVRLVTTTQAVLGTGGVVAVAMWLLGWRQQAVVLVAGLGVMALLQSGLKDLVDRPRPTGELVELRAGFSSPSFPAGHVMSPTLLYGFLLYLAVVLRLPLVVRVALVGWSAFVLVLTGPANVYVGVHWPSDVLGGYAWGAVLVLPLVYADRTLACRR
ncbi:MAG TPA: phosphatase PAP2 family protein [Dehalococcoidia bacterium]|nr:phosphatase PAP2 family protein [Dehalococcoidia bacterium]